MASLMRTAGPILAAVLLVLAVVVVPNVCYVVDQRELAVVLAFGKPVREQTEAGLYFRVPFVHEVRKLPSTRQFWGGDDSYRLPDLPTADGKKVEVVPWAIWRIKEPTTFVRVLVNTDRAEQIVAQVVRSAVRDGITQYDLAELVRSSNRNLTYSFEVDQDAPALTEITEPSASAPVRVGREKILAEIKRRARENLAQQQLGGGPSGSRGIELIDVGVAQIDFVPEVRNAAFERLTAFMNAIASHYTNEGEREKQEILNRTRAEVERIEGEGSKRSNEIRGEVDAEIIRAYAEALDQASEFFTFVRTLEAYKKALTGNTNIILTTDNEFLRLLDRGVSEGEPPVPAPTAPAAVGRR